MPVAHNQKPQDISMLGNYTSVHMGFDTIHIPRGKPTKSREKSLSVTYKSVTLTWYIKSVLFCNYIYLPVVPFLNEDVFGVARRQAIYQLNLSDQHIYCLLRCD